MQPLTAWEFNVQPLTAWEFNVLFGDDNEPEWRKNASGVEYEYKCFHVSNEHITQPGHIYHTANYKSHPIPSGSLTLHNQTWNPSLVTSWEGDHVQDGGIGVEVPPQCSTLLPGPGDLFYLVRVFIRRPFRITNAAAIEWTDESWGNYEKQSVTMTGRELMPVDCSRRTVHWQQTIGRQTSFWSSCAQTQHPVSSCPTTI